MLYSTFVFYALVAQWIERQLAELKVRGSNPLEGTIVRRVGRMVMHWFRKPAGEIPCRFESCTLRQFSKFGFWAIVASPSLRSGSAETRILYGFLKSENNFCPLKRKFGLPKANINLKNLSTNLFLSPSAKEKVII